MEATWLKRAQRDLLIQNPVSYLNAGFHVLLTSSLPRVLDLSPSVSAVMHGLRYEVTFSEICTYNDGTHLSECFKHNLTYRVPVTAKMQLTVAPLLGETEKVPPTVVSTLRLPLFYVPMLTGLNSLQCSAIKDPDPQSQAIESGIFVIDGHMRTCPGTKGLIHNTILLLDSKTAFTVHIRSSHEGNRTTGEGNPFRPTSSIDFSINKTPKRPGTAGAIICILPFSRKKVAIGVLAQALGCDRTKFIDLIRCVSGVDYDATMFRCYEIHLEFRTDGAANQHDALLTLARLHDKNKNVPSAGVNLLKTEIFPHLNVMYENGDKQKLYLMKVVYLAMAASMNILFAGGKIKETSRDYWQFASIIMPQYHIGKLIKQKIKDHKENAMKLLRRKLDGIFKKRPEDQHYPNLRDWWSEPRLSERIQSPVANGNFSRHGQYSSAQLGITMPLVDNNPMGIMNQLQRTSASMRRTDGTNTAPRKLPKDAYRGPCAAYTPEGAMVGLVTSWACMTKLTIDLEDPKSLVELVEMTFGDEFLISIFDTILEDPDEHKQQQQPQAEENTLAVQLFNRLSLQKVDPEWYIFINNCGIPTHFVKSEDVARFIRRFRDARRRACVPRQCFLRVTHHPRQIRVICEGGQVMSPLIVLDNLHKLQPRMSFQQLIGLGIVEYVNTAEEQSICKVAISLDDLRFAVRNNQHADITHMEFDPAAFLGLIGASVVFSTSQPGARTSYAIHQWKQIITAGPKPFRGNILYTELTYNCAKLVHTRVAGMCPMNKDGYGNIRRCALIPEREDQEDLFCNHRQEIERGLSHALTTRLYSTEITAPTVKTSERFEKPIDVLSKKDDYTYDAIDDVTGLTRSNWYIPGGHPIQAKTKIVKRPYELAFSSSASFADATNNEDAENKQLENDAEIVPKPSKRAKTTKPPPKNVTWRREVGVCTQHDEAGIINGVDLFATKTGIGMRSSVVTSRPMEKGNKITNDGANKGTNSENRSSKDMYFNEITGEIISLIAAPTSIISRMLMSTMTEGFIGLAVTLNGDLKFGVDTQQYDGSMRSKLEIAGEIFVQNGRKRNGGAIIRCGKTGERIKGDIAELIVYCKPLLHLADKKLQFRSKGPRHTQTRQPLTGRRKKGATRFGELESAATTAQGAAAVLLGRLRDSSDPFEIFVCAECSNLAVGNKFINYAWCPTCKRRDTVYIVKIAFIFLYNYYERLAMGNKTLIHIKPHNHRMLTGKIPTASFVK